MNNFNLPKEHSRAFDYFLGFFAADGHENGNSIVLKLHSKDREILMRFQEELSLLGWKTMLKLNCESKLLKNRTISYYDCLMVHSRNLCTQFDRLLGFGGAKSRNIRIPSKITHLADFVRGYFDGDGYIVQTRNGKYITIQFSSLSKSFLEDLAIRITQELKVSLKVIRKLGPFNCYRLEYRSFEADRLASWMYNDTNLYIPRKKEVWVSLRPYNDNRVKWSNEDTKTLLELDPHSITEYQEAAKILGKTYRSVQCKTHKLRKRVNSSIIST